MRGYYEISKEARNLLAEIIEHEKEPDYWRKRFDQMQNKEEIIIRGCFGELKNSNLILVDWGDGIPYYIQVLKDGYLYEEHLQERMEKAETTENIFEKELKTLLERTQNIKAPINAAPISININEYNRPSNIWINDVEIFFHKYLTDHPLADRIKNILSRRGLDAYSDLIAVLESISSDAEYISQKRQATHLTKDSYNKKHMKEYDVFLSHANKDKINFVDELYGALSHLGISIFYDKTSLEWGDKWKQRILDGTAESEFAIIVISENFFDREWTEKELTEFLNRQNNEGQKIILPIMHNITHEQLKQKYPTIDDIQTVDSKKYTCDQIAILFAQQLIKRLKT